MIINVLFFIFLLPALVISLFSIEDFMVFIFVLSFVIAFIFGIAYFSYWAFYRGIEMDDMEGRLTRYGPMSGGDKEFFELMSKPFAYIMQFFLLVIHITIFKDLYLK